LGFSVVSLNPDPLPKTYQYWLRQLARQEQQQGKPGFFLLRKRRRKHNQWPIPGSTIHIKDHSCTSKTPLLGPMIKIMAL
jgi:hypothetical protein